MKIRILMFIILLLAPLTLAFDSELNLGCGGDEELVIGCLGDEELIFIGGTPIIQAPGSIQEPEIMEELGIIDLIKGGFFLFISILIFFLTLICICIFIILKRRKRDNE